VLPDSGTATRAAIMGLGGLGLGYGYQQTGDERWLAGLTPAVATTAGVLLPAGARRAILGQTMKQKAATKFAEKWIPRGTTAGVSRGFAAAASDDEE
jgi:hypothetical protein